MRCRWLPIRPKTLGDDPPCCRRTVLIAPATFKCGPADWSHTHRTDASVREGQAPSTCRILVVLSLRYGGRDGYVYINRQPKEAKVNGKVYHACGNPRHTIALQAPIVLGMRERTGRQAMQRKGQ